MSKTGRNDPCPCGSGKKYKKCCINKKPRKKVVMVGSPEPLTGLDFNKEKMELKGITKDGRRIDTHTTFSKTIYLSDTGKEKVTNQIQDKVIPNTEDLLRHLSSFDLIIGLDTNTKTINSEKVSVTGIINCKISPAPDKPGYNALLEMPGFLQFRDCPQAIHPEKYSWMEIISRVNRAPANKKKKYALITDHDLGNHIVYNQRGKAIFKEFYLPENFTLMYGRGDGSTDSILNDLIKRCDKRSTEVLNIYAKDGYFEENGIKFPFDKIPKLKLKE